MSRLALVLMLAVLVLALGAGCRETAPQSPATTISTPPEAAAPDAQPAETTKESKPVSEAKTVVVIKTVKGDITAELFDKDLPVTAGNFLALAEDGFYTGLTFHRVVPGFVIQGGDPKGNGSGGPGFTIPDEVGKGPLLDRGILSMAKTAAPDTAGSQFFVVTGPADAVSHLNSDFSTFGKVTEGMDVVDKIEKGDKIEKIEIKSKSADAEAAIKAAKAARKPGNK